MPNWLIALIVVGVILLVAAIGIYFAVASNSNSNNQKTPEEIQEEIEQQVQQEILNQELTPNEQQLTYEERYQLLLEQRLAERQAQLELDNLLNANANVNTNVNANANANTNTNVIDCPPLIINSLKKTPTRVDIDNNIRYSRVDCLLEDASLGIKYNNAMATSYEIMNPGCIASDNVIFDNVELDNISQCNTEIEDGPIIVGSVPDPDAPPGKCLPTDDYDYFMQFTSIPGFEGNNICQYMQNETDCSYGNTEGLPTYLTDICTWVPDIVYDDVLDVHFYPNETYCRQKGYVNITGGCIDPLGPWVDNNDNEYLPPGFPTWPTTPTANYMVPKVLDLLTQQYGSYNKTYTQSEVDYIKYPNTQLVSAQMNFADGSGSDSFIVTFAPDSNNVYQPVCFRKIGGTPDNYCTILNMQARGLISSDLRAV